MVAYVGLGANLEDPRAQVLLALEELRQLPHTVLTAHSSLWRSAPLGHEAQPEFVNAVAAIESSLGADALLQELQRIESAHARVRSFPNAPRTLDLDLLLHGDEVRVANVLSLPHPRMHERAFVLKPLLEIAPGVSIPGRGTAAQLLETLTDQACERIP